MKLTKSKLREMVKQELNEFVTTAGGTRATKRVASKAKAVGTKRADVPKKIKAEEYVILQLLDQ